MTSPAAKRLATTLQQAREQDGDAQFTQGTVTGATVQLVAVDVGGSTVTCPYVSTYQPRLGDVVWLGGPPGTWVCLGTISGPGVGVFTAVRATSVDADRANLGAGAYAQALNCIDNNCSGNDFATFQVASAGMNSPNYNPPASPSAGKTNRRELADYLAGTTASEVLRGLSVEAFEYDPQQVPALADGVTRVGLIVDELERVAPDLVVDPPPDQPRDADYVGPQPHHEAVTGALGRSYNLITMLAVVVQAWRELDGRVAALEEPGRAEPNMR